jgi:hypothetical protein
MPEPIAPLPMTATVASRGNAPVVVIDARSDEQWRVTGR